MANIMKGAHEDFPDDDYIFNRTWIVNSAWVPRGNQRFAKAAYDYLRLTKDESIKPFVAKLPDFWIKNYWDDAKRGFFFRPALPRDMSKGWVPLKKDATDLDDTHKKYWGISDLTHASTLAWCYQTTGNEQYLDIARKAYAKFVERVKSGDYEKKSEAWTMSTDALMECTWEFFYVMEQMQAKKQ
jgi:hypothetical protein